MKVKGRKPRDLNQCRVCKLTPPLIVISAAKGKLRGICNACRREYEARNRNESHAFKHFYTFNAKLNSINFKLLSTLALGVYPIVYQTSQEQIGYIVLNSFGYYVKLWRDEQLYKVNLFGMSSLISNLNCLIQATPMPLESPQGEPVDIETVGVLDEPKDVAEALIMYDSRLHGQALKSVERAIDKARQRAKTLARRSINPTESK